VSGSIATHRRVRWLTGQSRCYVDIDWAWPTRGAAFIDPACFLLRLMLGGHTAAQAEAWARQCASWGNTPDKAINVFAVACTRLYDEIAGEDLSPGRSVSLPSHRTGPRTAWRGTASTSQRWIAESDELLVVSGY
jgi:hypothetical protein